MNRTKGILVAASVTGLVLVTVLALGFGRGSANSNEMTSITPQLTFTGTGEGDLQQELASWQKYGQELEQTVRIMQAREIQYQQQLESANQTIVKLEDEINRGNLLQPRSLFEEHEGQEFGEFDD